VQVKSTFTQETQDRIVFGFLLSIDVFVILYTGQKSFYYQSIVKFTFLLTIDNILVKIVP